MISGFMVREKSSLKMATPPIIQSLLNVICTEVTPMSPVPLQQICSGETSHGFFGKTRCPWFYLKVADMVTIVIVCMTKFTSASSPLRHRASYEEVLVGYAYTLTHPGTSCASQVWLSPASEVIKRISGFF